jgi:phosphinothricin acetyltransferase
MSLLIRLSRDDDVPSIAAIYAHHVRHGLATFEEAPAPAEEMARRRAGILAAGFPYLIAESDRGVAGYAYATLYRERSAYRFTLEDSIYVAHDAVGRGIGRALLGELLPACEAAGARQLIAVIGDSANAASIGLHAAFGFREAGVLRSVGFKLGRWVDSVFMQRALGPGDSVVP